MLPYFGSLLYVEINRTTSTGYKCCLLCIPLCHAYSLDASHWQFYLSKHAFRTLAYMLAKGVDILAISM